MCPQAFMEAREGSPTMLQSAGLHWSRTRGESENNTGGKSSKGSILVLNPHPRANVTRSPKQGPHKKDVCHPKILKRVAPKKQGPYRKDVGPPKNFKTNCFRIGAKMVPVRYHKRATRC